MKYCFNGKLCDFSFFDRGHETWVFEKHNRSNFDKIRKMTAVQKSKQFLHLPVYTYTLHYTIHNKHVSVYYMFRQGMPSNLQCWFNADSIEGTKVFSEFQCLSFMFHPFRYQTSTQQQITLNALKKTCQNLVQKPWCWKILNRYRRTRGIETVVEPNSILNQILGIGPAIANVDVNVNDYFFNQSIFISLYQLSVSVPRKKSLNFHLQFPIVPGSNLHRGIQSFLIFDVITRGEGNSSILMQVCLISMK